MGVILGVVSLKGGVGKTTISASLASDLANKQRKKVLLVDGNYSAPNLGIHMDVISPGATVHDVLAGDKFSSAIYSQYGVDFVPGNFLYNKEINPLLLRNKLAPLKDKYDFIIIDSSPSLNNELFSSMFAADELLLVTTPDYPTLSCAIKMAKLARQRDKKVAGLVINRMSNPSYQISLEEIQESTGIPVILTLREDASVLKSLDARVPAPLFKPRSGFSKDIKRLSSALCGTKEARPIWKKAMFLDMDKEEVNRELVRERFYTSIFKE